MRFVTWLLPLLLLCCSAAVVGFYFCCDDVSVHRTSANVYLLYQIYGVKSGSLAPLYCKLIVKLAIFVLTDSNRSRDVQKGPKPEKRRHQYTIRPFEATVEPFWCLVLCQYDCSEPSLKKVQTNTSFICCFVVRNVCHKHESTTFSSYSCSSDSAATKNPCNKTILDEKNKWEKSTQTHL